MEFTFISRSPQETIRCGRMLGSAVQPGSIIGLMGELGSGKTCFIKGLAAAISGVSEDEVTSPTFTFLQEFSGSVPLYHFDLYRLSSAEEIHDLGFDEYLYGQGVSVIEWADRAEHALPRECIAICISLIDETSRRLVFTAHGEKHTEILQELQAKLGGGNQEWH